MKRSASSEAKLLASLEILFLGSNVLNLANCVHPLKDSEWADICSRAEGPLLRATDTPYQVFPNSPRLFLVSWAPEGFTTCSVFNVGPMLPRRAQLKRLLVLMKKWILHHTEMNKYCSPSNNLLLCDLRATLNENRLIKCRKREDMLINTVKHGGIRGGERGERKGREGGEACKITQMGSEGEQEREKKREKCYVMI